MTDNFGNRTTKIRQGWPFSTGQTVGTLGTLVLAYLLLTQPPFGVIGLVVGLAALIFVTRRPEWGLYLLVLSVPGQTDTSLTLGSSRLTLTQASVALALLGWIGSRVVYRRSFVP